MQSTSLIISRLLTFGVGQMKKKIIKQWQGEAFVSNIPEAYLRTLLSIKGGAYSRNKLTAKRILITDPIVVWQYFFSSQFLSSSALLVCLVLHLYLSFFQRQTVVMKPTTFFDFISNLCSFACNWAYNPFIFDFAQFNIVFNTLANLVSAISVTSHLL